MANSAIYVAAHKPYVFPSDRIYKPIQVGAAISPVDLGLLRDDAGDNISDRNQSFCELTAMYWAWRNADHDIYGLAHYRRYFAGPNGTVASGEEIEDLLKYSSVVAPRKRHYYVQTVGQHYASSHHYEDLRATRAAVSRIDPSAVDHFDRVCASRSLHLYNMFVMRSGPFHDYSGWLFAILESLYESLDIQAYTPAQRRVYGYIGERLFNVWLSKNSNVVSVSTCKVVETEPRSQAFAGLRMMGRMVGVGRS